MDNNKLIERLRKLFKPIRSGEDRRKSNDPDYKGPELRSGKERRSRKRQGYPS